MKLSERLKNIETFAIGSGIRERGRLSKTYGTGKWRKRKGKAKVRLPNNTVLLAEIHWYEATNIGKKEFKIKQYLEY